MRLLGQKIMPWVTAICLCALSACATTQPWEREYLAHPTMNPHEEREREALREYLVTCREGAMGGISGRAGGLGCY